MTRFIFESDIPSWADATVLQSRLDRWAYAGFDTVMLNVDDGHGATWETKSWAYDPRVTSLNLKDAVSKIHDRGLSVVACVSLASFNPAFSHYPELRLNNFQFPFYDFWNAEFQSRRLAMLSDLVAACDIDGLALDYLRTGREALPGEIPAATVMSSWVAQVGAAVSAAVPILSVNHSSYASVVKEGVNIAEWATRKWIDGAVLFNYENPFPAAHIRGLKQTVPCPVWALFGNYDWINNHAETRSGITVSHIWRRLQREGGPDGIGVYLANLFTADQAVGSRHTQRILGGL